MTKMKKKGKKKKMKREKENNKNFNLCSKRKILGGLNMSSDPEETHNPSSTPSPIGCNELNNNYCNYYII